MFLSVCWGLTHKDESFNDYTIAVRARRKYLAVDEHFMVSRA